MFKDMYQHHYDKALVPMYVSLVDLMDYISEEDYDSLQGLQFKGVDATLTIKREREDYDTCLPEGYSISDIDVAWAPCECVLFREKIIRAAEDYIYSNEDEILTSDNVREAFHWMDVERKKSYAA